jgi:hypothetical protein
MPKTGVSRDMLLDGARMSMAATMAAIAGFLKERNIPLKEFISYLGDSFEGSFEDLQGRPVDEVMEHLLNLEVLPMGAEVISRQATTDKSEVVLTSLPPASILEKFGTTPKELLSGFGVTMKEYESIFDSYALAAKAIGLKFKHRMKDSQEIITLEK